MPVPCVNIKGTLLSEGKCILGNLVLHDRKTGNEWEIFIEDGVIYAEPCDKEERIDYRIGKVLGG